MLSSPIALSVRGLSKAYSLTRGAHKHTTAAEALIHRLRHPFQCAQRQTFWALRDVSFDLRQGDVVGIIGRNGAGKSTLLKILSRITEPTSGEADLYGRVGSLLEVGTGFHAELTGRENIYLNGAILGMSRREIDRQFDAIVHFAAMAPFLDTPVKRYSSGMYVRLAFAVAAHLNPEILIVDEVLAVGDAEFQRKCLGKMHDVARSGRTVLFVSHNMQAVALLCNKGIFLQDGRLTYFGNVQGAINEYLGSFAEGGRTDREPEHRPGSGEYRFLWAAPAAPFFDGAGEKEVRFRAQRREGHIGRMYLAAHVVDRHGVVVAQCDSRLVGHWVEDADHIEGSFRFRSPWLKPGTYRVDLSICCALGVVDNYEDACTMNITPVLPYTYSTSEDGTAQGVVFADFEWSSHTASVPGSIAGAKR
jgi:lipopolysaccharide transport system ATP-binding protein